MNNNEVTHWEDWLKINLCPKNCTEEKKINSDKIQIDLIAIRFATKELNKYLDIAIKEHIYCHKYCTNSCIKSHNKLVTARIHFLEITEYILLSNLIHELPPSAGYHSRLGEYIFSKKLSYCCNANVKYYVPNAPWIDFVCTKCNCFWEIKTRTSNKKLVGSQLKCGSIPIYHIYGHLINLAVVTICNEYVTIHVVNNWEVNANDKLIIINSVTEYYRGNVNYFKNSFLENNFSMMKIN